MKQNSNFQISGNSLALQWLGLGAFTAGAWVQSLVWGTKIPQAAQHGHKTKTKTNFQISLSLLNFFQVYNKFLKYYTY